MNLSITPISPPYTTPPVATTATKPSPSALTEPSNTPLPTDTVTLGTQPTANTAAVRSGMQLIIPETLLMQKMGNAMQNGASELGLHASPADFLRLGDASEKTVEALRLLLEMTMALNNNKDRERIDWSQAEESYKIGMQAVLEHFQPNVDVERFIHPETQEDHLRITTGFKPIFPLVPTTEEPPSNKLFAFLSKPFSGLMRLFKPINPTEIATETAEADWHNTTLERYRKRLQATDVALQGNLLTTYGLTTNDYIILPPPPNL
jgi:hypothetical protein